MVSALLYTGPKLGTLHDEYAVRGRIDESAQVTSSSSVFVDRTAGEVWDVLADLRGWAGWAPDFELKELDAVEAGREFRWAQAGTPLRSRFAVVQPGRELSWTGVFLGIYKAVDRMVLAPEGTGTRVTVEESLAGPLLPLFYGERKLRQGHEARLAALKNHLEKH